MVVVLDESLIHLRTLIDRKSADCLLDSGASHNFVSADWCNRNGLEYEQGEWFRVRLADGQEVPAVGKLRCFVDFGPMKTALTFYVLDCNVPCVLGLPFLQTVNPVIDWTNRSIQVSTVSGLSPLEVVNSGSVAQCDIVSAKQFEKGLRKGQYVVDGCLQCKVDGSLMFTHRHAFGTTGGDKPVNEYVAAECLEGLKAQFPKVFAEPKFPIVRDDSVHFEHRIRLKDEAAPPPRRKIYPLDQEELAELKKQIADMLSRNQIRPSDSPYGAPILFAKKKDGRLRLCVDYRALNKNTIIDSYPLPRIDELLSRLQGAKYFSRLDLRDGYFHVPIAAQDVHKTAFSCRYGTYEYLVMPFGLMNAPGTFQRIMNQVFFDMLDKNVIVYLDDILIFTKTEQEHRQVLTEVFRRLAHYSLYVKEAKCALFLSQVEFLGHIVTAEGISVQSGKIDAVKNWPQPRTVTELQQFLGLCNYYRRFILGYATIAAPLTDLLRGKPSSLQFDTAQVKAFQELKDRLVQAPVLKIYDPDLPIRVQSDASKFAVGAILEQQHNGNWHPVEYFSKRLNDTESLYCATEREMLGCILALQRWRQYLIGKQFDVLTDHAPNQYILTQQKISRRQVRWIEILAEYAANFVYKPGRIHSAPDALSRVPALNALDRSSTLLEAVRLAQEHSTDQEFCNFRRLATQPWSDFQVSSGIIVKKLLDSFPLVIPGDALDLRQKVLEELHTSPLGGHLGYRKLLGLVRTRFWWPHLTSSVQEFCRQCVLCQQTKIVTQKPLGLLQPLEPPSKPFEQVTMDLITHLPVSNGFDAVFTIVDRFSKLVTFIPCSTSSSALDLAQLFYDNIVCKFGMPAKIVSDRDSRFLSNFWQSLMKLLQCKVALSSGYHPQTDGQSERFHRSVEQILRCYVTPNQENWVQVLQQAAFALNSTVHAAHSLSPFRIVFGVEPTLPIDLAASGLSDHKVQAVTDFVSQRQLCFDAVKTALTQANESMARYADKHRRDVQLNVGDLVYVSTQHFPLARQLSRKLAPHWVGPFPISNVISSVAFRVQLPAEYGRVHPTFHVSYLRPHLGPAPPSPPAALPLDDAAAGEYEVEDILDSRLGRSGTEYLVKWLGYPVFESTWEPASHLANAPDILRQFLSRRGRRSSRGGE